MTRRGRGRGSHDRTTIRMSWGGGGRGGAGSLEGHHDAPFSLFLSRIGGGFDRCVHVEIDDTFDLFILMIRTKIKEPGALEDVEATLPRSSKTLPGGLDEVTRVVHIPPENGSKRDISSMQVHLGEEGRRGKKREGERGDK